MNTTKIQKRINLLKELLGQSPGDYLTEFELRELEILYSELTGRREGVVRPIHRISLAHPRPAVSA